MNVLISACRGLLRLNENCDQMQENLDKFTVLKT